MNDLIKREDVIKALLNLQIFGCINKPAVVGKCVATIMGLPSADRPQGWIPCSERLPEKDGFYLVTVTDGEQIAVCKMPFVESEWGGNWFDDEVVAWMPLPEPWKGADDE